MAFVTTLGFVLWRADELTHRVRAAEYARAELVAERLLQRAVAAPEVLRALPAEVRTTLRAERVVVDATIGWLHALPTDADVDAVVAERLDRATTAEFAARDPAAAEREYDTLLAGPLVAPQRLLVLSGALWQSHRAGSAPRVEQLQQALAARLRDVAPADLARPTVATAVAAVARLPATVRPSVPQLRELLPFLPQPVFAGLPDAADLAADHRAITARRTRLQRLEQAFGALRDRGAAGLAPAGSDALVCWQTDADGGVAAALVTPAEWLAAVQRAGRDGALAEWPWLVEPEFAATDVAFAGVPGLRALRPTTATDGERRWLLPALLGALLLALAATFVQRSRAQRREAAAVRAQAEFLTTVTHELKTPLAAIRLLGEMLAEGRARGQEQQYYAMLAGEAERLSVLIEGVLDLGRLERGERAFDVQLLTLDDVVAATLRLFAPVAERDGRIVQDRLGAGARTVRLDRAAFVQALLAVLDNARKYAPAGPIEVATAGTDAGLTVTVRDHGPGVPAAEAERVFERFVRGSRHAHGSTPGLGIGLHLARTIARRLGGDLVCTAPATGPGACFAFHFAAADTPPAP
ncbi:MAG: HAMP domain-containing histidine kinase [Planctomycetes bacterium]|nr:HAMP domain-containing histidine kinase [Planctomycetota bacterium]